MKSSQPQSSSSQLLISSSQFLQLTGHIISKVDLNNLEANGYRTVESVAYANLLQLSSVPGIGTVKANALIVAAYKIIPMGFITVVSVLAMQMKVIKISTGCNALNTILGGGIKASALTEVYGSSAVGKSQLAFTLSVTAQLSINMGGGGGRVAFFDSCGSFRSSRILEIAERYGLSPSDTLRQIDYARVFNCDHLLHLLQVGSDSMRTQKYGILIIDSIGDVIRSHYPDNKDIWERQGKLGEILQKCHRLSIERKVAVLLVNQVLADFTGGFGAVKAVGGNIMEHSLQTRLYMRRSEAGQNVVFLVKSPNLPPNQTNFRITKGGIEDMI